ncbi:zinc-binding alcohol dehydrogenase domain-containing protein 2 [Dorcoceras hygrometricum]|uniref:Zinc-binding alcohol dehydrogenase domain-containing protein 2 n=1 Tax=Dorcoceras hygrometricum TaxID=472368 RepID=A0A2Z7BZJ4_9LAMI|nr:zinc-binding alcohol dehydrogenase domain-containing protein 2 [Dorcoceras hygrometricum]
MELRPGLSAIVTGGAGGIAASLAGKEVSKFHSSLTFPPVLFIKCDVTSTNELAAAFEKHVQTYGGLDICINSAGIATPVSFYADETDGSESWRRAIEINLIAVIDCTRLAIQAMKAGKKPGVIINVGSASGLYPMYADPIYSGAKGGVVLFTRSLALYKRQGIRINALCPEFVQTELASKIDPKFIDLIGGFIPMDLVIKGAYELITDESKAGSCLWISNRRGMEYWPTPAEEEKYRLRPRTSRRKSPDVIPFNIQIPPNFQKIVVHTLSHNFHSATSVVRAPLRLPLKPDHVLLKIIYAGVNASDVNFSSGRYFSGSGGTDLASRLPFDAGFEAVGVIAGIGDSVKHLKVGTAAAIMTFGSYAEFTMVHSKHILPVARPDPEIVAMLTSGLTASIALEKAAQMESGKTVLVTAAAGGTGQFAVQLAKLAGNKVIATCGGKDKAELLKSLKVDRVIDYKVENIKTVLKNEFPKGVDIIYESVGGEMFDICLNALATYGRLVVIGMISQYQGEHGWQPRNYSGLCEKILAKSQTVAGFFLVQYAHLWQHHLDKLVDLYSSKKLKVAVDPKPFFGIHSVADAVDYLHSGKSVGKVVVCLDPAFSPRHPKL